MSCRPREPCCCSPTPAPTWRPCAAPCSRSADAVPVTRASAGGPLPDLADTTRTRSRSPSTTTVPTSTTSPAHTGLTSAEVVAAHTGTPWRVAFGGFVPGFAYLVGGDPRLRVPRRDRPRPSVPAGCGRPGRRVLRGLPAQLTGRLAAASAPRRPRSGTPSATRPPCSGRASPCGSSTPRARREPRARGAGHRPAGARRGRRTPGPGRRRESVAPAPPTARSYRLGARLVGNARGRAALEVLLGGLSVRARGRVTVALTGAPAPATSTAARVAHATLVEVPDGAVLTLGMPATRPAHLPHRARRHRRAAGAGVAVDRHALRARAGAGARSATCCRSASRADAFPRSTTPPSPSTGRRDRPCSTWVPGPRAAWVGGWATGLGGLLGSDRVVGADSDRVGLRLTGPPVHARRRLARRRAAERGDGARRRPGATGRRARASSSPTTP